MPVLRYGPVSMEIQYASIPSATEYPRAVTVAPWTTKDSSSVLKGETALSYTAAVRLGIGNTTFSEG